MSIYRNLSATMHFHNQKHEWSCVASAFEFVAKLHGLIQPESFPLQDDPKNQKQSFGDSTWITSLGLICQNHHYSIEEVLPVLEKETTTEKVSLVALLHTEIVPPAYHIYCVIRNKDQLLLVDPAGPRVVASNTEDLAKAIQRNHLIDKRKTLDIFQCDMGQDN